MNRQIDSFLYVSLLFSTPKTLFEQSFKQIACEKLLTQS